MDSTSFPPEQIYRSRDNLELDLDYYAAIGGYKWIIRRSNYIEHAARWKILYSCNQFRKGCQFSINVAETRSGWVIRHRTEARFYTHNHPTEPGLQPSQPPSQLQRSPSPVQSKLRQWEKQLEILEGLQQLLEEEDLEGELERQLERELEREPEPERQLEKQLPTCSKCHLEGHRRGAKKCTLRDRSSSPIAIAGS
ncbi:hypothetical protein H0G86_013315 [Trichoderma simmonsii]|uniref:Uncharacterized protein n=1 Tax=Trichoderma simmonsii TaxID=1491479 RepID=A0A8G0L4Y3_9HYPO|nr:hypothetical protein H0G86_013315 [Trichoderma simmonsii]